MAIPITVDGRLSLEDQEALVQETEERIAVRLESFSAKQDDDGTRINQFLLRLVDIHSAEPLTRLERVAGAAAPGFFHAEIYVEGELQDVSALR